MFLYGSVRALAALLVYGIKGCFYELLVAVHNDIPVDLELSDTVDIPETFGCALDDQVE